MSRILLSPAAHLSTADINRTARNPEFVACEQQRYNPASPISAFVIRYLYSIVHVVKLNINILHSQIGFYGLVGSFQPYLVRNPENKFSHASRPYVPIAKYPLHMCKTRRLSLPSKHILCPKKLVSTSHRRYYVAST